MKKQPDVGLLFIEAAFAWADAALARENYQKGVELRAREFKAIVKFYEEAKPIFGPYIGLISGLTPED